MDEQDALDELDADAAVALLALGGGLEWRQNDFIIELLTEVGHRLVDISFVPGEVADTEEGIYTMFHSGFLRDTWSNLSGTPMVDVTFYEHFVRETGRMQLPPAPFRSEAAAKAACDRHWMTGKWG